MNKRFCLALTLTLLVSSVALARLNPRPQANAVGTWDVTIESPQGQNKAMLVIKKDGDKFSGALKSPRGERPLESVTVAGSDITFVMKVNMQGNEMVFTYKGKVEKDSMKGDADFGGMATGTWSAVPHREDAAASAPAAAPQAGGANVSGDWNFTVETGQGSGSPSFSFKQDGENLTGTYKGQFGEAPVMGTVKGSDIKFTIKISAQGQELTLIYSGKIESKDSMKGTVQLGELGEGTWTAKRK